MYEEDKKLRNVFLRLITAHKEGFIAVVRDKHPNRKEVIGGKPF